jgi:hypothetical protein
LSGTVSPVVLVVDGGRVLVGGAVLVGNVLTTGGTVVVGTSLKTTSGFVAVVAGAGAAVEATGGGVVRGGVVAVVVDAGVDVVVDELLEVVDDPGALRPSITTVDGGPGMSVCSGGRITFAAGVAGDVSRATAATRMPTTSVPTPSATRAFVRDAGSRAAHHIRNRSSAGGRPNAAFLPMDDHAR